MEFNVDEVIEKVSDYDYYDPKTIRIESCQYRLAMVNAKIEKLSKQE